jgi:hypothetical protein
VHVSDFVLDSCRLVVSCLLIVVKDLSYPFPFGSIFILCTLMMGVYGKFMTIMMMI